MAGAAQDPTGDERFGLAFEHAPIGMAVVAPGGGFLRVNAALCRFVGHPEEQLLRLDFQRITHPGDLDADIALLRRLLAGDVDRYQLDKRYLRADGEVVWGRLSVSLARAADGAPAYLIAQIEDIDERKRMQDMLARREREYRLLAEHSSDLITRHAIDGTTLYASPAARALLGREPIELLGIPAQDLWHPDDRPGLERAFAAMRCCDEVVRTEARLRHRDGSWVWVESANRAIRDPMTGWLVEIQSATRDLSERRRLEAERHAAEAQFEAAFAAAPIGVAIVGADRRWVRVNRALEAIAGRSAAALEGRPCADSAAPEDRDRDWIAAGRTVTRFVRPDGAAVWVDVSSAVVPGADGRPPSYIVQLRDVTAERDRARALRESEERSRTVITTMAEGVVLVGADGLVATVNAAAARFCGTTPEAMVGTRPTEHRLRTVAEDGTLIEPEELPYRRTLRTGEAVEGFVMGIDLADGRRRWVSVNAQPVHGGDGAVTAVVVSFSDISDIKRAHAELERSNHDLEHFAYIASHDLSEPLRVMSTYAGLLARRHDEALDDRGRRYTRNIVDGAARMRVLIDDLLAYSRARTRTFDVRPFDAGTAYDATMANLARAVADADGTVTCDPLPEVRADYGRFCQLLQNLIANGIKFRGGPRPAVHVGVRDAGPDWEFTVADNGIGIDPAYHARIFELFQRLHTSDEYPGTGLGLAICKEIVDGHGGRIWLDSAPGRGTRFSFTLPKGAAPAPR